MFHKPNDLKSESDRLGPPPEAITSNFNNERIISASTSKQQHYHNYFGNNPKEETKSHSKPRARNFHSLSQHSQTQSNSQEMQPSNTNNLNQRNSHPMTRSTTNPQLYQAHTFQHAAIPSSQPSSSSSKQPVFNSESPMLASSRQPIKQRTTSTSAMMGYPHLRDEYRHNNNAHNFRQDQQERDTDEVVTIIKEELENDLGGFKESELETLGSLERNLPLELSFLIRQQAYCMARMNYLDRQVRELKEVRQVAPHQVSTTSTNQSHINRANTNTGTTTTTATATHTKNGNFIPSDDSGGEYSRATISDDDELSSLLDQIAKSVRPERNINQNVNNNHQRANYSVISNQPQQYAILNSNQLHHQAVPVFVMGSPIAVAHPSSISSNVLPGVHFQPEPRYNQYYEDFYVQNNHNSSTSTIQKHNGIRSQQFDSSISALEQLVSQKEKRQIKSQLKSADNWLKMRSSGGLCNLNDNFSNTNNGTNNGVTQDVNGSANERSHPISSSSANIATENSNNRLIEENMSR